MTASALALAIAVAAAPTDTLVVGLLADPVSLEPHRASDLVSAAVIVNVCDTLVRQRSDGERTEAGLATTWATGDARTWTFTLREGVRFHDGAPLDADAVVVNLELLRRERAFPGRARRAGRLVVSIELDAPNAALLATLSQPFFSLQSPRALEGPSPRLPVGTGPFRLVSTRPGQVDLEANSAYWGTPPRLARVQFKRYSDEDALLRALASGEVDVTSALSQARAEGLHGVEGLELDSQVGLNLAFLVPNHERAPFSDRRVRLALSRAIDRPGLVGSILGGHGAPARNPLPPSLWGYASGTRELTRDLSAARRLLREAGLPDGFSTTLLSVPVPRPYLPRPLELARQLQTELAAIGVTARLVPTRDWAEYVDRSTRGDFDLAVLGWQADTTDPNDFLSALLASEAIGTTNRSRYSSPEMDLLLRHGRQRSQPGERSSLYRQAQELFQREMPWIPLYHVSSFTAHGPGVHGLAIGPTGLLRYDKAWKGK